MLGGDKLIAKVPLSWKKTFISGVIIPHELRNCSKCSKNISCDKFGKLVILSKEFSTNLNKVKRQPPNQFGHMLIWYKKEKSEISDKLVQDFNLNKKR